MKTISVALILIIGTSLLRADWRIDAFNQAETIYSKYDQKEADLMELLDPKTSAWYALELPKLEAERKMARLAFMWKLDHEPETIAWKKMPAIWARSFILNKKEQLRFAQIIPGFSATYEDYLRKDEALKAAHDALKARNQAYDSHGKQTYELAIKQLDELRELQKHVLEWKEKGD